MIKNIILVGSGKGGVGKSTIALNLSVSLAQNKKKIGLLDADIYGPSIPKLLDIKDKPQISESKKIIPYQKYGIKVMSIGNMVPSNNAIIWRGVMASRAIKQLIQDVDWGDLDFLFIDLPPGTSRVKVIFDKKKRWHTHCLVSRGMIKNVNNPKIPCFDCE